MTDTIERLTAALSDRYRIERELGAGGMATVYLAEDLKHERKVAIKVLRPELAAVIGAERFLREIKTIATLQHPHILGLIDSGEVNGTAYYVMPYVEGESLRDRLNREKQLPISDALRLATEVAGALDYAHRHGVIHRDIKPENILLHDGSALVADFGIALAVSSAGGGSRMTETGMSLGTPHYMSPEQAMGEREITARSDVYALGAMTYEMLIGDPPFTGSTAQAIVAKVMTSEPAPLIAQRKNIPPEVEDAVLTALEKLPADRFETAAEFAAALGGHQDPTRTTTRLRGAATAPGASRTTRWVAAALLAVAAGAAGYALRGTNRAAGDDKQVEFAFRLGDGGQTRPFMALSYDGRRIAQAIDDSAGSTRVLVRDIGSTVVRQIAGADGADYVDYSHDGLWLGFSKDGKIYKVPSEGGPATVLADSAFGSLGWAIDGGSVFYSKTSKGLWQASASSGPDKALTTLDSARREFAHWYPQALPGGKAVIFTAYSTPASRSRIEAVDLATGKRSVLVEGAIYGRYSATGHLLYARDGAVFAVPFDAATLKVTGIAKPVLDDVASLPSDGMAGFAVADNGTLAYLKSSEWRVSSQVVWADRTGKTTTVFPDDGSWAEPRLSPDGRWIALTRSQPKRELFLFDIGRSSLNQLTHTQSAAFSALWLSDSRSLLYSFEDPVYELHRISIDASAAETTLVSSRYDKRALSVSANDMLVYSEVMDRDRVYLRPLAGGTSVIADARPGAQRSAILSPDGRWLAYEEVNQNERPQVYARAVDGSGGRIQISLDGGNQPRWTRDGREIVYRKGPSMMASSFQPATGEVGPPSLLFQSNDVGRLDNRGLGYDVTPDGSRFLLVAPVNRPAVQPLHVILNWGQTLTRKAAP
ncbi:MAG: protein kinase [Gemmatimonadales bacterium]